MRRGIALPLVAALVALAFARPHLDAAPSGANPAPVALVRPDVAAPSAMGELGRRIFFDATLSSSGRLSCASCHSPQHAYGPPDALSARYGGPTLARQGVRAVPSLMYLERQPNFSIGPDDPESEGATDHARASASDRVPQGGLSWDGRADTLQTQALGPLLDPDEMDGGGVARVATRLRAAPYASLFVRLFGPAVFENPRVVVSEALFAVARYQIESTAFHPYSSKFDAWLEGKARFTAAELRGYQVFNDPRRGNCAACHLDRPRSDGLPPPFTDHQYEALGVPRNRRLAAARDRSWYDLGLCGPIRSDLRAQTRYCGMFATPTLRNVATRRVFFHNGVYHSLREVLDFYDFRAVAPQRIYPRSPEGAVDVFDDLPTRYRGNVDVTDPPFDRKIGEKPPMSARDEEDVIAFLKTLTDGYRAEEAADAR